MCDNVCFPDIWEMRRTNVTCLEFTLIKITFAVNNNMFLHFAPGSIIINRIIVHDDDKYDIDGLIFLVD